MEEYVNHGTIKPTPATLKKYLYGSIAFQPRFGDLANHVRRKALFLPYS